MSTRSLSFQAFTLDLDRHCLIGPDGRIQLRPKSFDVLRHLVLHAGQVVTKSELMSAVWSDVIVGDESLTQCIHDVRRALGPNGRDVIQTIPRRGYLLSSDAYANAGAPAQSPIRLDPVSIEQIYRSDRPSIVVVPFASMSVEPDQDFFADGIAEDLLTELSRQAWLFVMARSTSFTYRGTDIDPAQVGGELGVRYLLRGSVRRSADRLKVTAQLIETATSRLLWSESFNRSARDVFEVQDEIANAVTRAIAPAIVIAEQYRSLRKHPNQLDAWEAYQRGLWHMSMHDAQELQVGRSFLLSATKTDTNFAAPHSWLAQNYCMAGSVFGSMALDEALEHGGCHARRAVALDPADAEAKARLAVVLYLSGDADGALSSADAALVNDPFCAEAHALRGVGLLGLGRHGAALEPLGRSIALSPRSPTLPVRLSQIAEAYYLDKNYENAVSTAMEVLRRFPKSPQAYRWLAAGLAQLGRRAEAKNALRKLMTENSTSIEILVRRPHRGRRIEDHEHLLEGLRKAGWDDQA